MKSKQVIGTFLTGRIIMKSIKIIYP